MKMESDFEYPMEISGIKKNPPKNINNEKTGMLVKIRPCAEEYENKTFHGYCRSQEVLVVVNQKDQNNKYHKCGKFDLVDPQQKQALIADCLIEADDDGTACVPNDKHQCEVEERPVWP